MDVYECIRTRRTVREFKPDPVPEAIALANKVAGRQPTKFAAWARTHFATPAAA